MISNKGIKNGTDNYRDTILFFSWRYFSFLGAYVVTVQIVFLYIMFQFIKMGRTTISIYYINISDIRERDINKKVIDYKN